MIVPHSTDMWRPGRFVVVDPRHERLYWCNRCRSLVLEPLGEQHVCIPYFDRFGVCVG